jgi:hypothetical protein
MKYTKQTSLQNWISEISVGQTHKTSFQFITNADGSIRWIWPSTNKKPIFLKLYSVTSPKAKLYVFLIRLIFILNLQTLFTKKDLAYFDDFIPDLNLDCNKEWAIFTGTVGVNRKMIIAGRDFNNTSSFTKVALTEEALNLIKNEAKAIDFLLSKNLRNTTLPTILSKSKFHIQLSDISGGKRSATLSSSHINSLQEINDKTASSNYLGKTLIYKETIDSFRDLNSNHNNKIPKAMNRKLQWLVSEISEHAIVNLAMAHRDFTPWNCYQDKESIALYDLEMGQEKLPKGFDAFHFIIQNGILVKRDVWSEIYSELKATICPTLFENNEEEMKKYLKLYLLINI